MTTHRIEKYAFLASILFFFSYCENKTPPSENTISQNKDIIDEQRPPSENTISQDKGITDEQTIIGSVAKTPFNPAIDKGLIENEAITEASGLTESRNNKRLFWTHNDSKDANRLFLFDEKGIDKGTFYIDKATNRDWEDLDMVTINNTPYIYIADIGDNDEKHNKKYIYRIKEPKILQSVKPIVDTLRGTETIVIEYPDKNRNAEAMMIDQKTFDIYIVSKFEDNVQVYLIPYPQSTTQPNIAKALLTLPITYVTAGSISADNQEILIKNLDNVFYWKRKKDESIVSALKRPATILPYLKEPQGESIAFANDGSGYFTLSEIKKKIKPHLYFYKRN
jgi:hypothetical protein